MFTAVAALLVGQLVYLLVLGNSERLLALLPAVSPPALSDTSHVGTWTWANGLRALTRWNLPLAAMLIHGTLVALIVRRGPWPPIVEPDAEALERRRKWEVKKELSGAEIFRDVTFHFGPPLLAVAAALFASLSVGSADLRGKTIVAYDSGTIDWRKPEYNSAADGTYGMLPIFVESLGGTFVQIEESLAARPCRGRRLAGDPAQRAFAASVARSNPGLCAPGRFAAVGWAIGGRRCQRAKQRERSLASIGHYGPF